MGQQQRGNGDAGDRLVNYNGTGALGQEQQGQQEATGQQGKGATALLTFPLRSIDRSPSPLPRFAIAVAPAPVAPVPQCPIAIAVAPVAPLPSLPHCNLLIYHRPPCVDV